MYRYLLTTAVKVHHTLKLRMDVAQCMARGHIDAACALYGIHSHPDRPACNALKTNYSSDSETYNLLYP